MLKVVSLAESVDESNKTLLIEHLMNLIERIEEGEVTGYVIGTTGDEGIEGYSVGVSVESISHVLVTLLKEEWD